MLQSWFADGSMETVTCLVYILADIEIKEIILSHYFSYVTNHLTFIDSSNIIWG